MATSAPSSASRSAIALPIPRDPPVTRATFPATFFDMVRPPTDSPNSTVSARDVQRLAREPPGVRRGEVHRRRADVIGPADAAQWRGRLDLLAELALGQPGGVDALGL